MGALHLVKISGALKLFLAELQYRKITSGEKLSLYLHHKLDNIRPWTKFKDPSSHLTSHSKILMYSESRHPCTCLNSRREMPSKTLPKDISIFHHSFPSILTLGCSCHFLEGGWQGFLQKATKICTAAEITFLEGGKKFGPQLH